MNNEKNKFKNDFKIFEKNKNLVFLNSAATSLKPSVVVNEIERIYNDCIATLNKSIDSNNNDISKKFEGSLNKIGDFIGAKTGTTIPTYGTTDSINKIASLIIDELEDGDEIILGKFEHASNILPWINIAKDRKKEIVFKWYELKDFKVDLSSLKNIISKKTKVISIAHSYNTFGTKNNISEIRNVIGKDIKLVVDAAQSIGHIKIDVKKMDCDYLVFSAHKAFGPHGLGFMYIKNIEEKVRPFNYGGGMNKTYSENDITLKKGINMFLSGTQNIPSVIAFGVSIDYMNKIGIDKIEKHNYDLKEYAEKKISSIKNVRIINEGVKSHNLFFEIKGVSGEDVAYHLSLDEIIVRPGSNCVKIKNNIYKQHNSLRASFHIYNDRDDVDKLYNSLLKGGDYIETLFRKKPSSSTCL